MSCILLYCIALYCEPSIIDNKSTVLADGHTVAENTGSLLTSEVKRHRARLVLGWGTAWEDLRVLSAFRFAGFMKVTIAVVRHCLSP